MASPLGYLRAHLRPTDDDHRVTTLELLFDLVFVYAITNVTALMEHDIGAETVLEGLITLAVVWFGWCAYTWLGNQAQADEGLLRVAMVVAMAGMFFVAISIPYAFEDDGNAAHRPGHRLRRGPPHPPRCVPDRRRRRHPAPQRDPVHARRGDGHARPAVHRRRDRRRALKWWWLAAVVTDQLGVYFVRSTRWRLHSASHFAERFGLIIIIAIGESIVAVGAATSSADLGGRDAAALLCGLAIAVCLWWLYFDVVARVAEDVLRQSSGVDRARLARDSYTYIHFLFVAGIVFVAFGLVVLIGEHGHVDAGRYALYGGIVCYLVGHLLFRLRNVGGINVARTVAGLVLLAGIPTLGGLSTLGQVAVPAVVLSAVVVFEVRAFREPRDAIRHQRSETLNREA